MKSELQNALSADICSLEVAVCFVALVLLTGLSDSRAFSFGCRTPYVAAMDGSVFSAECRFRKAKKKTKEAQGKSKRKTSRFVFVILSSVVSFVGYFSSC